MNSQDAATLKAIGDRVIAIGQAMERKWGVGRLPLLVSLEWAEKFEREIAAWQAVLEAAYDDATGNPMPNSVTDGVRRAAERLERAWGKLDRLATENGSAAISGDVWEAVRHDGAVIAIVPTIADACKVVTEGRYVACYTLDEIANVLAALPSAISAAKQEWTGARIMPQRSAGRSKVTHDDPIPF